MKRLIILLTCATALSALYSQQTIFSDISTPSGIRNNGMNFGIAFGDFDNDGDDDAYVSRRNGANLLYRNNGDNTFSDVATATGVAYAGNTLMSVWGDFDNDGYLDLFLGNRTGAPNMLFRNNGNPDGTGFAFTEIGPSAGVNSVNETVAVLLADVDADGYIDIYLANLNQENILYHNNGDLTFTDITQSAGVPDPKISMGAVFFDYDNDGDQDLYLTHDSNVPNILYRNDGTGHFTDVSAATGANFAGQGMGVDFGDFNNDGYLDLYITNLYDNALLLNSGSAGGNITFTNIAQPAGVNDYGMGWGITILDCDNDGYQDIYMVNDSYFSPYPNVLYRNLGDSTFAKVSSGTPLASMYGSYGAAGADINGDGLPDIFVTNTGYDGNQLFLNQNINDNHWITVKTSGTVSNRAGIGARVEIEAGGRLLIDEVCAGSGYASQNSLTLHFGLGQATTIDKLTVKWPSGITDVHENIAVDRKYLVTEGSSVLTATKDNAAASANITAFPNPFRDQLNVQVEQMMSNQLSVSVLDLSGKVLLEQTEPRFNAGKYQISLDMKAFPGPGIYLIQIKTEKETWVRKVIHIP